MNEYSSGNADINWMWQFSHYIATMAAVWDIIPGEVCRRWRGLVSYRHHLARIIFFVWDRGVSTPLRFETQSFEKCYIVFVKTTVNNFSVSESKYRPIRLHCRLAECLQFSTHFYRAMHVVLARYCYRKSSVRLSVRP